MTLAPRKILVTGAAGFLGSHLCRRLIDDGFGGRVIALDDHTSGGVGALEALGAALTVVTADVRDAAALARCMDGVGLVFHLAGVADPRACERDPAHARAVNVDGTAAVVAAAPGRRLVLLSSAAVYLPADAPRDEQAPVATEGTYAATKLAAERLCLEAMQAGRLDAVVVRNFNTYGGGQAPAFLVSQLVGQGLREGKLQIASCRSVRDFTFVDDAVAALVALGMAATASGVFNLGSGCGVAVGDVALALGRLLGVPVICSHAPLTGNPHLVAVNTKLVTAAGWQPTVDLTDGLVRTIEWFRANETRAATGDARRSAPRRRRRTPPAAPRRS